MMNIINEVSCRNSNLIINYVKKNKPEALGQLLEDLDETYYTNESNWMSHQTSNLLYERAEKLFNDEHIMVEIGEFSHLLGSFGVLDSLVKLMLDPISVVSLSIKYSSLLTKISKFEIIEQSKNHAVIAVAHTGEYIRSRGGCDYVSGVYQGLLKAKSLNWLEVKESECAVPIWEKGVIGNYRFHLKKDEIWQEDLSSGQFENKGRLEKNGTFYYNGTIYGSSRCVYHMTWSTKKSFSKFLFNLIPMPSKILSAFRTKLMDDYEIIERQNVQLQQVNNQLNLLLKGKEKLTEELEEKVNKRNLELEKSLEQLKEMDIMKSYFISITSHELRTPLTIIKGALNLIHTEKAQLGPERFEKYFIMAQKNTERLILLLDDLLDLSRLEFGQLKLELDNVDLMRLIRESIEEFRNEANERSLGINDELEKNPPWIIGDQGRIKQILNNLISNALKFTPPNGNIEVTMHTSGKYMEIKVKDNGIGISEKEQAQIFEKFHQGNYTLTREAGGVGLGLAIVKDLVELHDGKIWVESNEKSGTIFYVHLPLNGPADPDKVAIKKLKENWKHPLVLKKRNK